VRKRRSIADPTGVSINRIDVILGHANARADRIDVIVG
jgi:hypothetical protein